MWKRLVADGKLRASSKSPKKEKKVIARSDAAGWMVHIKDKGAEGSSFAFFSSLDDFAIDTIARIVSKIFSFDTKEKERDFIEDVNEHIKDSTTEKAISTLTPAISVYRIYYQEIEINIVPISYHRGSQLHQQVVGDDIFY